MSHNHESHGRLPIGAGLVLIVWATCQFSVNLRLHSSLLTAAVYHNMIDGIIALLGWGIDRVSRRLERKHWALNISPVASLTLYAAIVLLVAMSVIGQEPTRFSWSLAAVESLDALVNLAIWAWLSDIWDSGIVQAVRSHLLIDALVGPTILLVSLTPTETSYTVGSVALVGFVSILLGHHGYEVSRDIHFHLEANCRNNQEP